MSAGKGYQSAASEAFFPFRLYLAPLPADLGDTTGAEWRTFLVRSGRVGTHDVSGTDGETNPDSEYPALRSWLESHSGAAVEVPNEEAAYVIWYQYTPADGAAFINHSADPGGVGEDWPGYPGPCTTEGRICRLIATVDTTNKPAKVRQFLRADEPDWYQACVNVEGVDKVLNVPSDGGVFDFAV